MSTVPRNSSVPEEFLLLLQCCEQVADPRKARGKVHPLPALLGLSVLGLMAGQSTILDVQRWASRHPEVWQALRLRRCPSVCTLWRMFQQVSVEEVQRVLGTFAQQLATLRSTEAGRAERTVALDGKTLCGVQEDGQPLRLLHAFASESALLLEAVPLPSHLEEPEAARAWVEALGERFPGIQVLTGDAAFAERSLCAAVLAAQRDYLVRVKKTNPCSSRRSRNSLPMPLLPACSLPSAP